MPAGSTFTVNMMLSCTGALKNTSDPLPLVKCWVNNGGKKKKRKRINKSFVHE